jgi:transposase
MEVNEKQRGAKYTRDFRQEAVRKVKAARTASAVAAMRGIAKAGLTNWVRADAKQGLTVTSEGKPTAPTLMPEQAELARLRAELARLTMKRTIAKSRSLLCAGCAASYIWIFSIKGLLTDHTEEPGAAFQQPIHAAAPNVRWSGNISYIATGEGWLCLAAVLDLHRCRAGACRRTCRYRGSRTRC